VLCGSQYVHSTLRLKYIDNMCMSMDYDIDRTSQCIACNHSSIMISDNDECIQSLSTK